MTLTQASSLTRKLIIVGVVTAVLGIGAIIGYNIWYQNYLASLPKVEEKPEVKFGKLPDLSFPSSPVSSSNYSYRVDTPTGDFPQTPKLMKVYFIARAGISLLAPEKSQKLAQALGFNDGPEKPSPTEHRYINNSGNQLNIDLVTGNFHYQKSKEASDSALVVSGALPKEADIVTLFKNFLTSTNLLMEDINSGQGQVSINQLPATATVSFLPKGIDNIPIITAWPNQGLVKAEVYGIKSDDPNQAFLSIDYTYWPIDLTTSSTYPLKTPQQALADLQAGKGFISQQPSSPQVSIASVRLAYFEPEDYTPYLQPVFVFEGPRFQALVPAISAK